MFLIGSFICWQKAGIPSENIRQAVLDFTYVSSFTTETGAQVLILDNQKAAPLIQELFFN